MLINKSSLKFKKTKQIELKCKTKTKTNKNNKKFIIDNNKTNKIENHIDIHSMEMNMQKKVSYYRNYTSK